MASAPQRHFAGRTTFSSSDDSDGSSRSSSPAPQKDIEPNQSTTNEVQPRRRRFKARVVTTTAAPARPGTDSGFLPVSVPLQSPHDIESKPRSLTRERPENDESSSASSADESSSSSASSSSSNSESSQREDRVESSPSPLSSHPVFRPASERTPPLKADNDTRDIAHDTVREEMRRVEARRLLSLALEEDARQVEEMEPQLPDDTDREEDHAADFALWRLRELLRIRRDREEQASWDARRLAGQKQREIE